MKIKGVLNKEKLELHPRNLHREQYDFKVLIAACSELKPFVALNKFGTESIDFSNPKAVLELNRAILKHFYKIEFWDIPPSFLCPPIPGRADYVHYLADLMVENTENDRLKTDVTRILDIGVGANCVYPMIGSSVYGWYFVGADCNELAIESAQKIVQSNTVLVDKIECRLQTSHKHFFQGIIKPNDRFDASMCNPPFHASAAEAALGNDRKVRNLKLKSSEKLNFGGQTNELWYEGGERAFVRDMIFESKDFAHQVRWFSSLVSKKENLPDFEYYLKKVQAKHVRIIKMAQGNKISRMIAWTFGL